MFSKTSKGAAETASNKASEKSKKPVPPSIVSGDLHITGDLNSEGEIQIDGAIDGDTRCKTLLVGETAQVKGEICADFIRVYGTVHGQIKARNVHLYKTARVVGDILHEELSIETGAFLEGHCKRITDKVGAAGKINLVVGNSTKNSPPATDTPLATDTPPSTDTPPTAGEDVGNSKKIVSSS
ncbi:MAG: polymer-forming cytoskeletal protein [Rhodospirillales bacterium]